MNWYRTLLQSQGVHTVIYEQGYSVQHITLRHTSTGKVVKQTREVNERPQFYRVAITYVKPAPIKLIYLSALNEEHVDLQVKEMLDISTVKLMEVSNGKVQQQ